MKKVISLILLISILFTMFAGVNVKSAAATQLTVTEKEAVNWVLNIYQSPFDFDHTNFSAAEGGDPQCVDLVKYYFSYLGYDIGAVGNSGCAYDLKNNAVVRTHYDVLDNSQAPLPGDVFVWNAYSYGAKWTGHTGIITSVDASNYYYVDWNGAGGKNKAGNGAKPLNNFSYVIRPVFRKSCATHTWNKGKVTTNATCTSDGVKTYTCTVCGETKTEVIKGGHKYKTVGTIKATLRTDGLVGKKCTVCNKAVKTIIYRPKTASSNKLKVTYNGKYQKYGVTVKDTKGKVISSKYYTLSYNNNRYVGNATVTVKFTGLYSGTKKAAFMIVPKGTSLKAVKGANSTSINVYWNKQTTQTSGYQIQYSTNSKFAKNNKSFTAKSDFAGKTLTKLKGATKYYFRIRTYKKVNGFPFYSGWSKTLSASTFAPKLTQKKAKALYIKAEDVATKWLFTDAGCYYMSHEYEDDPNTIYNYNGGRPAIPVHHKSIKSVAQLKKYLSNYFTANVYEGIVSKAYRDINGKLYFVGNYGIGTAAYYKLKSVSVASQKGANAVINVKILETWPYDYRYKPRTRTINRSLKIQYVNNKWRFTNPFYIVFCGSKIEKPQWW